MGGSQRLDVLIKIKTLYHLKSYSGVSQLVYFVAAAVDTIDLLFWMVMNLVTD